MQDIVAVLRRCMTKSDETTDRTGTAAPSLVRLVLVYFYCSYSLAPRESLTACAVECHLSGCHLSKLEGYLIWRVLNMFDFLTHKI